MPRKVLVIYAHPYSQSFSSAVLGSVLSGLSRGQVTNEVDVLDLYALDFEPRLVVNETLRRRDMNTVEYTKVHRQLLAGADHIVFVYPLWWGGFPAILKGFIDRVFVSGLAYSFEGMRKGKVFPRKLMKGKAATFIYTLDSPWIVGALDPGWFGNYFSVFWYCGFSPIKRMFLSRLKVKTEAQRKKWLAKVENHCSRL